MILGMNSDEKPLPQVIMPVDTPASDDDDVDDAPDVVGRTRRAKKRPRRQRK